MAIRQSYRGSRCPLQVLILDEISMISAELFNALEQMARDLRGSEQPFGGIQLILAGDFFQ